MWRGGGGELGANQEFSFNYIQTEMPIIHPRGAMDKQVAGYLSWELGSWVGAELINLEAIMMVVVGVCDFSRATWRDPSKHSVFQGGSELAVAVIGKPHFIP